LYCYINLGPADESVNGIYPTIYGYSLKSKEKMGMSGCPSGRQRRSVSIVRTCSRIYLSIAMNL